jgi:type IV pilus assembly protein PilY1
MNSPRTLLAPAAARWLAAAPLVVALLAAALLAGGAAAQSAPPGIPQVELTPEPPVLRKAKPTLSLLLSVEHPTMGAAYVNGADSMNDPHYDVAREYLGYFDPDACYTYDRNNRHFKRAAAARAHACDGTKFSGNFMNWATTSAIDILRYGMTGGDRVVDTDSKTVLQRAVLPKRFFNSEYFPAKHLSGALAGGALPAGLRGGYTGTVHVANCLDRIHFGTERVGSCDAPLNNSNLGPGAFSADPFFYARVQVCDGDDAAARPGLCALQPSGNYKPVGHLQRYGHRLRVAAFGYLREYGNQRYGGVLRAPMKYVGPRTFDNDFNQLPTLNPQREWDERTGRFVANPHGAAEGISGVINYLNQFGRTSPTTVGEYKEYDPSAEMYYEALRYVQGLAPTPQAVSNLTPEGRDGYPVYTSWDDPHPPITGHSTTESGAYSCVMNNILGIGDVRTNGDRSLPGNSSTGFLDFARAARPSYNEPDFVAWTRIVGGFETNAGMSYVDGKGVTRRTTNPGTLNFANANLDTKEAEFCPCGGSYYMSGAAYWANTHDIRASGLANYPSSKARPGMRARTFMIDVNERGEQTPEVHFKQNPFYVAAKYGGFVDRSGMGNPFLNGEGRLDDNAWSRAVPTSQAADGKVARTFFQANNAHEMLASLDTIFAEVLRESANIANAALASSRLTTETAIYQGSFDPVYWSGNLARYRVSYAGGNMQIGNDEDPQTRFAAAELDKLADTGTRRIFVGKTTPGATGTATEFRWAALDADHKDALRRPATGALDSDAVGEQRLAYLRGDRSLEAAGTMRRRGSRLGDIVNSGAVYSGKPANIIGDAAYNSFAAAHRTRPDTIFVGANDGMLHAFRADTMAEQFAYVPSFVVKNLRELTLPGYIHRSYVDATADVAEAKVGTGWKTVLVSGAGGGGQGVFALDVSNPAGFGAGNVLWEFTDRHDPALGNVIGRPRIVKLRTTAPGARAEYKYYAVVAGGVNNHVGDGRFSATGNAAIFVLDLAKGPSDAWTLGSNYFRIELPSSDTTRPNGVAGFSVVKGAAGEAQLLYAGDLQGQVWKLDFGAAGRAQWNALGLSAFKTASRPLPFFRAADATGKPQPITMEPEIAFGPGRGYIVTFGTGKLLEPADTAEPYGTQSFYAVYDNGDDAVPNRSYLKQATSPSTGVIQTGSFAWGMPANAGQTAVRAGWYFNFPGSADGERQIGGITLANGMAVFGTLEPPAHGCAEGGGRLYVVDLASGEGEFIGSSVGLQGQPLLVKMGTDQVVGSTSDGRALQPTRYQIVTQGSAGIKPSTLNPDIPAQSVLQRNWRQVFNYQELWSLP